MLSLTLRINPKDTYCFYCETVLKKYNLLRINKTQKSYLHNPAGPFCFFFFFFKLFSQKDLSTKTKERKKKKVEIHGCVRFEGRCAEQKK